MKKVGYRCSKCKDEVLVDAWVVWNEALQQFEIHSIHDDSWCETCMETCDSEEYILEPEPQPIAVED